MTSPSPTFAARRPRLWLDALLFLTTCATTCLAGGVTFAATLMAILVTHEMGHYVAARRHGIDASLPYFIPLPPFFSIGTMGAVIRMRSPIGRRDALIDVGAAGPLAGLCVALPLLAIGLARSPVVEPAALHPGEPSMQEGNSLLYLLLKLAVKGRVLPAGGWGGGLGAMGLGARGGLLVTFINLMPIGQLDGGHVAYAYFGERQERHSRWLHRGLFAVGLGVLAVLGWAARAAGHAPLGSLGRGLEGAAPWFVWAALLLLMRRLSGGLYHPPVGPEPLTPSRRALFWLMAALFVLLFTPVPMRQAP